MPDTPTSEALRFSVESVGFAPATTDTVLVRVRGTWHAGSRQLGPPLLVVEEDGDSRAFAMLPGGSRLPAAGPAGALWSAGFAVPAELPRRAGARWSLRAGEVTAGLPAPSELAQGGPPAQAPAAREELDGEIAAEQARARRAEELLRAERDRALAAAADADSARARAGELERGARAADERAAAAQAAADRAAARIAELEASLAAAEQRAREAAEVAGVETAAEAVRRRQAETVAASAREARQVAEQRAAEVARAAQRREAELRAELGAVQRRLDELEASALLRAAR